MKGRAKEQNKCKLSWLKFGYLKKIHRAQSNSWNSLLADFLKRTLSGQTASSFYQIYLLCVGKISFKAVFFKDFWLTRSCGIFENNGSVRLGRLRRDPPSFPPIVPHPEPGLPTFTQNKMEKVDERHKRSFLRALEQRIQLGGTPDLLWLILYLISSVTWRKG